MFTQATLVAALITFAILGVGTIALVALLGARNAVDEDAPRQPELSPLDAVEQAIAVHREHVFLKKHPEWTGRDFRNDPLSPWNTEAEFENSRQLAGSERA